MFNKMDKEEIKRLKDTQTELVAMCLKALKVLDDMTEGEAHVMPTYQAIMRTLNKIGVQHLAQKEKSPFSFTETFNSFFVPRKK